MKEKIYFKISFFKREINVTPVSMTTLWVQLRVSIPQEVRRTENTLEFLIPDSVLSNSLSLITWCHLIQYQIWSHERNHQRKCTLWKLFSLLVQSNPTNRRSQAFYLSLVASQVKWRNLTFKGEREKLFVSRGWYHQGFGFVSAPERT